MAGPARASDEQAAELRARAARGARALTIRIESFVDPFPGPSVELRGPWEFRVAL